MKHLVACILILSLFSFQISELLIYVSFKINQEYIAANFCVEKDLEESNCHGCCQLKKKLNEQEDQKDALPVNQIEKPDINLYAETPNSIKDIYPDGREIKNNITLNYNYLSNHKIFHPPRNVPAS